MIRKALALAVSLITLSATAPMATGQEITSQTIAVSEDEQALKQELIVPLDREEAWAWFTDPTKIQRWMAPVAEVDLTTGGSIQTNYDPCALIGTEGTITLNIINFVPGEMLTLQSSLDNAREASWMNDAIWERKDRLYNVTTFTDAGEGKTRITSWGLGYGTGEQWDTMIGFFTAGNAWTYGNMFKAIEGGTVFAGCPSEGK